ncbi:MAG: hypothetical protein U9Q16_02815, partial [Patescibacteria group bacterium]|nr:hypothetical protein [Patescibacteria group bacterium]
FPETEIINLEKTIIINGSYDKFNEKDWVEDEIIPGKIFSSEKEYSEEFTASGKAVSESKARGIIRVYNNYSTRSERWVASTRFVSAEGKLFRSIKKETIPGGKYESGKLVPGYADIEVQAAETGEEYNIEASTFSLPAFAGTVKYTSFYGKSFDSMKGGFKGEVAQVTEQDLNKAKNNLAERAKAESREFLKSNLSTGFILEDEAILQEIIEESASVEVGSKTEHFNYNLKINSQGIGFERENIEKLAIALLDLNISEDKRIQEEGLEINYYIKSVDIESGEIEINLKVKAKSYSNIQIEELKKAIFGKSSEEAKIFLDNCSGINSVEIKSWPLFRRKIAEDLNKIELKLRLD